jgi:hypothetical protein
LSPIIESKRKNFLEDRSSKSDAFRFAEDRNFIDNLPNPIKPSKKLETDKIYSGNKFWTDSEGIQRKAGSSSQSSSPQRKVESNSKGIVISTAEKNLIQELLKEFDPLINTKQNLV